MIKFTAIAQIHHISPVIKVNDNFSKREVVLDDSWTKDGNTNVNLVSIEFSGDKMQTLDNFYQGQRVQIEAYVKGKEYNGKYFNTLRGMSIAPHQFIQQQAAPTSSGYPQQQSYPSAPGYTPQSGYGQGGYPQQPSYPNQGGYPANGGYDPSPAPAPMPGAPQGGAYGPGGQQYR